ncbi:MAG: class I adenylate-forming enzyme family protein [Chitinophagaceae bacterium]
MLKLVDHIVDWANQHPDKLAIIDADGTAITYQELVQRITLGSEQLKQAGLIPGERVLIVAKRNRWAVINYLMVHLAGGITVLQDDDMNSSRRELVLQMANPILILEEDRMLKNPIWVNDRTSETSPSSYLADILFTTGTTGMPKGVCITHEALMASVISISTYIELSANDVELISLPLAHSFCLGRLRTILYVGGTIVFVHGFVKIGRVIQAIQQYGVTSMGLVPAAWSTLLTLSGNTIATFKDQLKSLEFGSSFMTKAQKLEVVSLLPHTKICMNFGLTESPRSLFLDFNQDQVHIETLGKASPGNEVAILDDDGSFVPEGQTGEICFSGPILMQSYWHDAELTQKAFHGKWFRSGDLGSISEEGYVSIFGRYAEVINVGGLKVSPLEVEKLIQEIPGVQDAACAKISHEVSGEAVAAYIVNPEANLDAKAIRLALQGRIEQYKMPVYIEFVNKIPRADSGKIIRKALIPSTIKKEEHD